MKTPAPASPPDPPTATDWARQLGQVLVDRAWLSTDRVQRAFEVQMISGGSLGTCLLELGFLQLARHLDDRSSTALRGFVVAQGLREHVDESRLVFRGNLTGDNEAKRGMKRGDPM